MNKLIETIFRRVLLEGRREGAIAKYPDMAEDIEDLSNEDPSGSNKYLDWSIKQIVKSRASGKKLEVMQVADVVRQFHSRLNSIEKKDINQYKTFDELLDVVLKGGNSKREERKFQKGASDIVFEDNRWIIVCPKNTQAACFYGKGTKWCTSAAKDNAFDAYSGSNNFIFYLIDKGAKQQSKFSKIAFMFQIVENEEPEEDEPRIVSDGLQIFDAIDEQVDEETLRAHIGPELDTFLEWMHDFAIRKEKTEASVLVSKTKNCSAEMLLSMWPSFANNFEFQNNVSINKSAPSQILIGLLQKRENLLDRMSLMVSLPDEVLQFIHDESSHTDLWKHVNWQSINVPLLDIAIEAGQNEKSRFMTGLKQPKDDYEIHNVDSRVSSYQHRRERLLNKMRR